MIERIQKADQDKQTTLFTDVFAAGLNDWFFMISNIQFPNNGMCTPVGTWNNVGFALLNLSAVIK